MLYFVIDGFWEGVKLAEISIWQYAFNNEAISLDGKGGILLTILVKHRTLFRLVYAPLSLEVYIRAKICAKHITGQLQMISMVN